MNPKWIPVFRKRYERERRRERLRELVGDGKQPESGIAHSILQQENKLIRAAIREMTNAGATEAHYADFIAKHWLQDAAARAQSSMAMECRRMIEYALTDASDKNPNPPCARDCSTDCEPFRLNYDRATAWEIEEWKEKLGEKFGNPLTGE